MTTPVPQKLAEHALAVSTSDHCVVVVEDSTTANLRWANNTLTTNGVMHAVAVTVVAFKGRASASVSGTAATKDQVRALVEAADAAAASSTDAEDHAPLAPAVTSADWDDEPAETSIEVFGSFAKELGDSFHRADAEGRVLYGFVSHDVTTTYLASSTGLRLRHAQPTGHYGITAKDSNLTNSAWVGGATRDFQDVDAATLDAELVARLGWGARRVSLDAGRYDTILPPAAVADLMIDTYWYGGALTAHDGQSVFSHPGGGTRIGERIAQRGVNLWSDPSHAELEAMPFVLAGESGDTESVFDNGLPLTRTDWLRDGELTALMQTRHSAELTGQPLTPSIDNLVLDVDGATGDTMDLVRDVERGLLLTCLWYIRVVDSQTLLLTGLTRDGVYLVENGEITAAVNNFRFNESPVDLLRRFTAASATAPALSREWGEDYFSRTAMPALRIPDFNMSSVSQAL